MNIVFVVLKDICLDGLGYRVSLICVFVQNRQVVLMYLAVLAFHVWHCSLPCLFLCHV